MTRRFRAFLVRPGEGGNGGKRADDLYGLGAADRDQPADFSGAAEIEVIGERAVALYRDMSCAPCFLAKPEHCPRGMACVEMLDPPLVHQMARMFLARPVERRVIPLSPRLAARAAEHDGEARDRIPLDRTAHNRAAQGVAASASGRGKRDAKPASRAAADTNTHAARDGNSAANHMPEAKMAVQSSVKPADKVSRKRVQREPVAGPK